MDTLQTMFESALIKQGKKTKDICGKLTTTEFTDLVAKEMF